jgi:hypothetical protein
VGISDIVFFPYLWRFSSFFDIVPLGDGILAIFCRHFGGYGYSHNPSFEKQRAARQARQGRMVILLSSKLIIPYYLLHSLQR